jgi:hypothetical protein
MRYAIYNHINIIQHIDNNNELCRNRSEWRDR